MNAAIIVAAFLLVMPAIMVLLFCGQQYRLWGYFQRHILRRNSIAKPIARSLLSPSTGGEWRFGVPHRMEAKHDALGVYAWGYDFSEEAHLFHGSNEIRLAKWEQFILNRALRARAKLLHHERSAALFSANEERKLKLAEGFIDRYEGGNVLPFNRGGPRA